MTNTTSFRARKTATVFALAAVAMLAACTAPESTAPDANAPQLARVQTQRITSTVTNTTDAVTNGATIGSVLSAPLAQCPKATYDSSSAVLGPWGGSLQINKFRLVVPAGALTANVEISMVRPADETASVRFHPHGLVFPADARPVLTLNFSGCKTSEVPFTVYVSEQLELLETLPTIILDLKSKTLTSRLDHFSRYAVAW